MTTQETDDNAPIGYEQDHPAVKASLNAMSLGRKSWEAARDECYAWLECLNLMDPGASSNVGERYISFVRYRRTAYYEITVRGATPERARIKAPDTLPAARVSPLLKKAVQRRDSMLRASDDIKRYRTSGAQDHLRLILLASEAGRLWLENTSLTSICANVRLKAATAEAYARDEWSARSPMRAHMILASHPDRVAIVRAGVTTREASALCAVNAEGTSSARKTAHRKDPLRHVGMDFVGACSAADASVRFASSLAKWCRGRKLKPEELEVIGERIAKLEAVLDDLLKATDMDEPDLRLAA